jgi:phenylpropionate dioxygenase-like ring-hydroxylating dioxygenase large terminal subunit
MTVTDDQIETRRWTIEHGFGTGPLRISGMTDPEYYEREVERIWKRTWHCIGKAHTLPNRGDYFVKELPFAKTSILVTRGRDGALHAFHNVCSHRCNKLVWNERGNSRLLRCRFHGWVYGLDGSLQVVTDEPNFFDLDRDSLGLTPVAVDTMSDFIFVNLAPEPPETLPEYLGEIHTLYDDLNFAQYTQEYTWTGEFGCNWKILRDAFLELYHISSLHAVSAGRQFVGPDRPFVRALDLMVTKYHAQFSMTGTTDPQFRPTELLAYKLGGESTGRGGRGAQDLAPQLNRTGAETWYGDANMVFPSFGIIAYPSFYLQNNFWPVAHDRAIYELRLCMPEPSDVLERWTQENARIQLHAGVLEDVRTLEYTQQVIESGAKTHYQLQDAEMVIRQSHHWVQQICGPYPDQRGQ